MNNCIWIKAADLLNLVLLPESVKLGTIFLKIVPVWCCTKFKYMYESSNQTYETHFIDFPYVHRRSSFEFGSPENNIMQVLAPDEDFGYLFKVASHCQPLSDRMHACDTAHQPALHMQLLARQLAQCRSRWAVFSMDCCLEYSRTGRLNVRRHVLVS